MLRDHGSCVLSPTPCPVHLFHPEVKCLSDSVSFSSKSMEPSLEEEMATHSSIFAWEIPWTEEASGLQPMGSQSQT